MKYILKNTTTTLSINHFRIIETHLLTVVSLAFSWLVRLMFYLFLYVILNSIFSFLYPICTKEIFV